MEPQAAGLVLCALLFSSTFGHHELNLHQPAYSSEKSRHVAAEKSLRLHAPSYAPQPDRNSENLLLINSTINLVAVVNESATVAQVLDVNYGYSAIYCGDTGNVYILNLETKVGIFIPGNSSRCGWSAQSETFENYFKSLKYLEYTYKEYYNSAEKFRLGEVSPRISLGIKVALLDLSRGEYFVTQARALKFFIDYSDTFVRTLRGPLHGVLKIVGSGAMPIQSSVRSLVVILHTLGEIVCKTQEGVGVLTNLQLDWSYIFNSRSWSRSFIYLFSKLVEGNVDVKSIIRDYSDNISILLSGLAGNSTEGTNGVLRVLAEVKGIILGECTAGSLVDTILLKYFSSARDCSATVKDFKKQLWGFKTFVDKIGVNTELIIPINYVNGVVKEDQFVEKGIDLYKITSICLDRTTVPLRNVVRILSLVQKDVSIESSVAFLLYRLIGLVVDRSVDVIRSLIPGVEIDCSADFLVYAFRGAKVSDLRENLYEFLRCRPVIGTIVQTIENTLGSCTNISLREILASPRVREYRCLITKTLANAIRSIQEGSERNAENARHLGKNNHGLLEKHSKVKSKQHTEKHTTRDA